MKKTRITTSPGIKLLVFIILTGVCQSSAQQFSWRGPVSIQSACNMQWTRCLIDGDGETIWNHWVHEQHWVVFDMGETGTIGAIRSWHRQQYDREAGVTAIYISDDGTNWGESLGSLREIYDETSGWKESDFVDKEGRYLKLVSENADTPNWREIEIYSDLEDNIPPAAISDLHYEFIDNSSIRLQWTATGDNGFSGTATSYDIRYSTDLNVLLNWNNAIQVSGEPVPSAPGSADSVVVSGLDNEQVYYVAMKAIDEIPLASTFSNILRVQWGVDPNSNIIYVLCAPGTDISDEIQKAVDALDEGGTIYLPEGDFQFNSAILMPGGISISGKGSDKTILHSNGNMFFDINHFGSEGGRCRISGIGFYGLDEESGTYTGTGFNLCNMVDFRIDHCIFWRIHYNIGINSRAGYPQSRGVIDNCSIIGAGLESVYGIYDARVWEEDMKLGTAEATFIEDCYIEHVGHPTASYGGGHYVLRHCEIKNSASIDAHGQGFDGSGRGARCSEIYENNIYYSEGAPGWTAIGLRAGGGIIFNNTFNNYEHAFRFTIDTQGFEATGGVYPTADQIHDMWIWNNTLINIEFDPTKAGYQDDFHDISRTISEGVMLYANEAGRLIQINRDFFMRAPTVGQDGFTYTPYTYPHPLREEASTNVAAELPEKYLLEISNYPNPFNPSTKIVYNIPKVSEIEISIFNTLGQKITTLFHGISQAGRHEIDFSNTNMSSGVYIYQIKCNSGIKTGKMLLLK